MLTAWFDEVSNTLVVDMVGLSLNALVTMQSAWHNMVAVGVALTLFGAVGCDNAVHVTTTSEDVACSAVVLQAGSALFGVLMRKGV